MTVGEVNIRLEKFEKDFISKLYQSFIARIAAFDIVAMVVNRVQQTGRSGRGGKFKPYSTKPLWVGYNSFIVDKKAAYQRGKKAADRWATIKRAGKNIKLMRLPGGYAELRRLQGLQTAYKDFWVRGSSASMWANFGLIRHSVRPEGFTLVFGGKTQEARNIIDGQSEREGQSIIALTDGEVEAINRNVSKLMDNELRKHGL